MIPDELELLPETPPDLEPQQAPRRRQQPKAQDIGKLPPHSLESEQGVLGCILLSPNEAIETCLARIKSPEAFYDLRHRDLYGVLVAMYESRDAIDLITLQGRLKSEGKLEAVGGLVYISNLQDEVPSASHLEHYLGTVSEQHKLRKALNVCSEAITRIHSGQGEPDSIVEYVEREVFALGESDNHFEDASAKDLARSALVDFEARLKGEIKALPSGFRKMDAVLRGGFRPGKVYVVAARPGNGKTAMAACVLLNVAQAGIPVGLVSLEMAREEIRDRFLSVMAQLDYGQFDDTNKPNRQQVETIGVATAKLSKLPIRVDDKPNRNVASIRGLARRWKARHKIGLLCVDYLQLVSGAKDGRDRREEVDAISAGMKSIAKELNLPVLLLAQLNRDIEKDGARKPRMSDLRESGAIEQDADFVGFLYSPKPKGDEADEFDPKAPREVRMLVAKQRSGPMGADLRFVFHPTQTRFEEAQFPIGPND